MPPEGESPVSTESVDRMKIFHEQMLSAGDGYRACIDEFVTLTRERPSRARSRAFLELQELNPSDLVAPKWSNAGEPRRRDLTLIKNDKDRMRFETALGNTYRDVQKQLESFDRLVSRIEAAEGAGDPYYSTAEQSKMQEALSMALAAHQTTLLEGGRIRKSDGAPYITHVLAVAIGVLELGLPWTFVASALLHDVYEDVPFSLQNQDGQRYRKNSEASKARWREYLQQVFGEVDGSLINQAVEGVTAPPKFDWDNLTKEQEAIIDKIRKGSLHKIFYGEETGKPMRTGKRVKPRDFTREGERDLVEVIYQIEHFLRHLQESPAAMISAIIKVLDTFDNFNTIEYVKFAKVLRGRIIWRIASLLGMYVPARGIAETMAEIVNLNTPSNALQSKAPKADSSSLSQDEIVKTMTVKKRRDRDEERSISSLAALGDSLSQSIEQWLTSRGEGGAVNFLGWQWFVPSGENLSYNGSRLTAPELVIQLDPMAIQKIIEEVESPLDRYNRFSGRGNCFLGTVAGSFTHLVKLPFGDNYRVKLGTLSDGKIVTFECAISGSTRYYVTLRSSPTPIDYARQKEKSLLQLSPEVRILQAVSGWVGDPHYQGMILGFATWLYSTNLGEDTLPKVELFVEESQCQLIFSDLSEGEKYEALARGTTAIPRSLAQLDEGKLPTIRAELVFRDPKEGYSFEQYGLENRLLEFFLDQQVPFDNARQEEVAIRLKTALNSHSFRYLTELSDYRGKVVNLLRRLDLAIHALGLPHNLAPLPNESDEPIRVKAIVNLLDGVIRLDKKLSP